MTTFFNWRVLSYTLHAPDVHLQRSVAVQDEQAVYAMTWRQPNLYRDFRTLKSASALDSPHPPPLAARRLSAGLLDTAPWSRRASGPTMNIHKVPFSVLAVDPLRAAGPPMRKINSSYLNAPAAAQPPNTDVEITEYSCVEDPHVPALDRQLMLQAATTGEGVVLAVLNGLNVYMHRTRTREWLPPLAVSTQGLLVRQFISIGGPHLFIQYTDRGGGPQFALVNVAARTVHNPIRIPALPRSHGLTFFTSEHDRTLNAIVDRWPRCSREWWSLDVADVLNASQCSVLECRQHICDPIELHYSEFVPVGNRWIIGVDGGRWNYHDYEENLIPHQINYVDGQKLAAISSLTVIDKSNGKVQKVKTLNDAPGASGELPAVTCSPSFYISYKATDVVTLELPGILSQITGQLVLRMWGGSLTRLPSDIDAIWKFFSDKNVDDTVVVRILSFMLN